MLYLVKNIIGIVYVVLLALLVASCMKDDKDVYEEYVHVGDHLPVFSIVTNRGDTIDTGHLRGKGLVLVFFNTSCSDCQRELPVLNRRYLAGELPNGGDGQVWQYVCVSREEDSLSVAGYWSANGLSLPFAAQTDRRIFNMFASAGIPRVYVADSTGVIVEARVQEP